MRGLRIVQELKIHRDILIVFRRTYAIKKKRKQVIQFYFINDTNIICVQRVKV